MNVFDAALDLKRTLGGASGGDAIRAQAANGEIAQQFEAIFIQMMLKSMQDASFGGGLGENEQTGLYRSMQHQQLAMDMAGAGRDANKAGGLGIADAVYRMLETQRTGQAPINDPAPPAGSLPARQATLNAGGPAALSFGALDALAAAHPKLGVRAPDKDVGDIKQTFIGKVWAHAKSAAEKLGIPEKFMVAQAALETGWGRGELHHSDGQPTYNLFNIKAGRNWTGPTVEVETTEYVQGRPVTEKARFRAYGSYAEAFADYARLISESPRYAGVVGEQDAARFAQGLQRAGYATDPQYAAKVVSIIKRI